MSQESISKFDNRPEPICITEIQAITDEKIQKQNNYKKSKMVKLMMKGGGIQRKNITNQA